MVVFSVIIAAAVARGRKGGRPSVMTAERLDAASKLRKNGLSYRQIGGALGVGASTVRENLGKLTVAGSRLATATSQIEQSRVVEGAVAAEPRRRSARPSGAIERLFL
jgi:DNA invertase Pin-like site-specific DNA recombinase